MSMQRSSGLVSEDAFAQSICKYKHAYARPKISFADASCLDAAYIRSIGPSELSWWWPHQSLDRGLLSDLPVAQHVRGYLHLVPLDVYFAPIILTSLDVCDVASHPFLGPLSALCIYKTLEEIWSSS